MAKKKWRPRRKPQIPTQEQDMFIRKAGFNPYEWLTLWEIMDNVKVMHRETRETMIIEKQFGISELLLGKGVHMRLIDADALIDNAREMVFEDINVTDHGYSWDAVTVTDVMNAPTIEAVPVAHGEWAYLGESGMSSIYGCSCCGYRERKTRLSSFCPNCGARMEREEE